MAHNPVGWFEIYVQDISRAKNFYEAVFEVKLEKLNSPENLNSTKVELWAFPMAKDQCGCPGALVKMEGMSSGGTSTLVYFSSEDCAMETARALKNGGKVHREKFSIGEYGFISLLVDTEGNMIGVHSMM